MIMIMIVVVVVVVVVIMILVVVVIINLGGHTEAVTPTWPPAADFAARGDHCCYCCYCYLAINIICIIISMIISVDYYCTCSRAAASGRRLCREGRGLFV